MTEEEFVRDEENSFAASGGGSVGGGGTTSEVRYWFIGLQRMMTLLRISDDNLFSQYSIFLLLDVLDGHIPFLHCLF